MTSRSTRRHLVAATAVGTIAAVVGPHHAVAAQTSVEVLAEAVPPTWRFILRAFEDPYEGEIVRPAELDPGMRVVGAEVDILNESEAPLDVNANNIRLVDADGREYPTGRVLGSAPSLANVNMLPGQRTRGWVWFEVPEDVQPAALVYVPPSPRLELPLGDAGAESTPEG